MDWFKFYIGDFMRDTTKLTFEQRGAYLNLMMVYYSEERPLPLDHDELYRATGAITDAEKDAILHVIGRYFDKKRNGYNKKRINEEIKKYQKRREVNKANRNKSSNDSSHDSSHDSGGEYQKPETRNQKPDVNANAFTPPTLEDVKAYFKEKGYSQEAAEKAFHYYDELNWHDRNGTRVQRWKTKMINNWFREENKAPPVDEWKEWVERGKAVGVEWKGVAHHSQDEFKREVEGAENGRP